MCQRLSELHEGQVAISLVQKDETSSVGIFQGQNHAALFMRNIMKPAPA
jgi:hypothetical protein